MNCLLCLLSTAVLDPVPTPAVHSSMLAQTNRSHGTLGWRPLLTIGGLLDNCQVSGCRATTPRSLNQLLPDQAACCLSSSGLASLTPQPASQLQAPVAVLWVLILLALGPTMMLWRRYRDPVTGLPYHDLAAYRTLAAHYHLQE